MRPRFIQWEAAFQWRNIRLVSQLCSVASSLYISRSSMRHATSLGRGLINELGQLLHDNQLESLHT